MMTYRTTSVLGVDLAYREAGVGNPLSVLLLHGVPSSSRMYDALMRKLGGQFHLVAVDYPGFGNSAAPGTSDFYYTFDHLADMVLKFADQVGLGPCVLFMQDYGAPIGMRVAATRPELVLGMVFQNGNVYADGLGPIWESRRAFWSDRAAHEAAVIARHLSLPVTRERHVGDDPDIEAYNPDLWMDEVAFLNRPGMGAIQAALIYDYQRNIESYPHWQRWLRVHRPPTLVIWGKFDLTFTVAGAWAFRKDLPDADIQILDGGHFVMDTKLDAVAELGARFLKRLRLSSTS